MTKRKEVVCRPIQSSSSRQRSRASSASSAAAELPGGLLRKTIYFEDDGQDFLEWDLDAHGVVIACRPLQEWAWKGGRVVGTPKVGEFARYQRLQKSPLTLNHRIVRIVEHPQKGRA